MNARTFGNGDAQARVEERYADVDWNQVHADQVAKNRAAEIDDQLRAQARRDAYDRPARIAKVTHIRKAAPGSIDYLVRLSAERFPAVAETTIREWAASVDRTLVSEKIAWLKAQPKMLNSGVGAKSYDSIPEGRYAVTGEREQTVFVKVTRGTRAPFTGRTFVNVQAGDELHRVSPAVRDALLAKIEADGPEAASRRYGREIGDCGRCGRTLTDEASREAGIGPVCASKGW